MTQAITACMGGFCAHREKCQRYRAPDRREPAERLCAKDRHDRWIPVQDAYVGGKVHRLDSPYWMQPAHEAPREAA